MTRLGLELRTTQHLTLTPQLQQSIRLLQLSTLDLQAEIAQALADNPMLELQEDREPSESDVSANHDTVTSEETAYETEPRHEEMPGSGGVHPDDRPERMDSAGDDTLREHLLSQLGLTRASHRDAVLVALLIDELDENGYLASSPEEILSWLPEQAEADIDELKTALTLLQSFDPPGIGAQDMAECLVLQLRNPDLQQLPEAADSVVLACARELCRHHLPLLATRNIAKLRDALGCLETTAKAAHALIRKLNPRPGRAWTVPAADYAVPDVVVRRSGQGWVVSLNHAVVPQLSVNALYAQLMNNQRESDQSGLHTQLQQARWMIRNVEQRFDTILRVAQAIVVHQTAFFSEGPTAMRPLILKDIASELGLHESTISRATTQKYMLTPFGTLELKHFFGSGVATEDGEVTSATAVQAAIRTMVNEENRTKPLSDSQITQRLADQGVVIARRTVAKYREALRIAPANLRKAHLE
jgi:RNA polymerase sigma-54 factor